MQQDVQLQTQQDTMSLMQQLVQRLKLLNYQKQFLQQKGMKPITFGYFVNSTNSVQQFGYFKNLCKWLLQLNDKNASDISKYQDPITVATNIMTQCKKLQIPCQFPALKLKNGSGQQVILILNQLAGKALKTKKFNFKKPKYQIPSTTGQQVTQIGGDQGQQSIQIADQAMSQLDQGGFRGQPEQDKQIIQANVSQKDWQIECKRVATKLKLTNKNDSKQWRTHIDNTKGASDLIKQCFPKAHVVMQKMNDELTKNLQKINKSQKNINLQMSGMGSQYKQKAQQMKSITLNYNNLNISIKQMNDSYRKISQRLQIVNNLSNQQGNSMSDNSNVVKIRASIHKITTQLKSMDVRIGVLNYCVFQQRFNQRRVDQRGQLGFNVLDQFNDDV